MSDNDGRILDYDPSMGIIEKYHEQDGKWIVTRDQDVSAIIEANKAQYNSFDERARHKSETFNKYATIPLVTLMELERKGITRDHAAMRKWLDDRDNQAFRTRPGRLSK